MHHTGPPSYNFSCKSEMGHWGPPHDLILWAWHILCVAFSRTFRDSLVVLYGRVSDPRVGFGHLYWFVPYSVSF